jgi:plastocyanin
MTKRTTRWGLFVTLVLTLGGCGGSSDGEATASSTATAASITIKNFAFSPERGTFGVGAIKVVNGDGSPHTVTADDGSFDTKTLEAGADGSVTLSKAGTYAYHCSIHDYMKGTVVVS